MKKGFPLQIRFSDIDLMGHVNNAVYLNYFEYGRMQAFNLLMKNKWDWNEHGIVLKSNQIVYHKPLTLHLNPIIFVSLKNIGKTSFTLAYEIKVDEELYTSGESVLVCFNYKKQEKYPINSEWLKVLKKLHDN